MFKYPLNTRYVQLISAPGKGYKYKVEYYTLDGALLGDEVTDLATINKLCKGKHKLRVKGTTWAVVSTDSFMPIELPKFLK